MQTGPTSQSDQCVHCEHPAAALEHNEVVRGPAGGLGHLTPLCTNTLLPLALKAILCDISHRKCLHILLFILAPVGSLPAFGTSKGTLQKEKLHPETPHCTPRHKSDVPLCLWIKRSFYMLSADGQSSKTASPLGSLCSKFISNGTS